uniref:Ig-like domain-containing protein n=1 Tax=Caenorhabditis tropicalis TaxID=1561998 RepID=A0A1I7UIZ8_9PELO
MLPCRRPSELRKSPIDGKTVCGPTVISSSPESAVVSLDDSHGLSQKHLSDSGKVEFCLEIRKIQLKDMGKYKCVASLAGLNSSKEFHVERDKIPIVLNSAEGIMIYCQFTICTFIGVCCIISCCVLRTGGRGKTRPKRQYLHAKVLEIPHDACEYCCDDSENGDDELGKDDWCDAETVAVRQYLQWKQNTLQDPHRYSIIPQIRHESLCRLSNESNNSECHRAPLARFDDPPSVSFDMTHL